MNIRTRHFVWFNVAVVLLLAGCQTQPKLTLSPTTFDALDGWDASGHAQALKAFAISCEAPAGTPSELDDQVDAVAWAQACKAGEELQARGAHDVSARAFFEKHFTPHQVSYGREEEGLLTGYYAPEIKGTLAPDAAHPVAIYGMPADVQKGVSYFSRAEIESGALKGRGLEIAWAADVVDVFFLQIQGSGYLRRPDGGLSLLQYAGKNNHAYTAIGKVLIDRGELAKEEVTMQSIRQWLKDNPAKRDELLNQNESYVFFKRVDEPQMPRGSQGVPLTPEHSLAVDPSYVPYGLPIYLQTRMMDGGMEIPFSRLMLAQDSGGAIKGALRGDVFFGIGDDAGRRAGAQKFPGRWTVLLPTKQGSANASQLASR